MSAPTCEQISTELVAFLDGELGDDARRPVASHVASCLTCRREIDRLTTVRGWVGSLPTIEPSASFAPDFWRRLEAERRPPRASVHRLRPLRWAVSALAAAAALVLVVRYQEQGPRVPPATPDARHADVRRQAPASGAESKVALRAQPKDQAQPKEEAPQVANVESLRPEDLPPELLDHPELFLRLPVVRHLERLEYFGSAHDRPENDGGAG